MKKQILAVVALALAAVLLLSACGAAGTSASEPTPHTSESAPPSEPPPELTQEPQDSPPPEDKAEPLIVSGPEDIRAELKSAISELRQPLVMDVSAAALSERPELDVKNLYFSLLSEDRAFCCAYDLTATVSGGMLETHISYMPYVTGEYPNGFAGAEISTLGELISLAEESLGDAPVDIRVMDKTLTPDDMNRALQQAGGGYVVCTLSRDGTSIEFAPAMGFTMEECLAYLADCDALARSVADGLIADGMSDMEKARALYGYLTENVKYDQRYYSDKTNMPYHAQTAYGALNDGLAICGGYSHALKLLFEKAGVPCFNVTGRWGSEYHMWSLADVGGEWLYFDATGDRGVSPEWWKYCGVDADALTGHTFDTESVFPLEASIE